MTLRCAVCRGFSLDLDRDDFCKRCVPGSTVKQRRNGTLTEWFMFWGIALVFVGTVILAFWMVGGVHD